MKKFKVGDKIRVKGANSSTFAFVGEEMLIVQMNEKYYFGKCRDRFNGKLEDVAFLEEEIELVSDVKKGIDTQKRTDIIVGINGLLEEVRFKDANYFSVDYDSQIVFVYKDKGRMGGFTQLGAIKNWSYVRQEEVIE